VADVAIVCGAGGALGGALVEAFLARGDRVVAVDLHAGGPETPGVTREAADLTSPDEVEALWERVTGAGERPRWVVNATGGFRPGTVAESEPDAVRFVQELNLGTAWWSCRAAARRLDAGGAIVNVSARAALSGGAGSAAYAVAKAGVVRLTQVLAAELAERRVRVNAILPALIDTPANRASMSPEALANAVPPEQVAAVVAFLCSDAAAAVSGAVLPVYGWA
jgi:NAD(P)-dependent dehydrogenase (short-subunit alcohol dehydrogenase family)